jgi:mannonate dehydratase
VFKVNYQLNDGFLSIDDTPGIGVDIDEEKAKKFPYVMARLPVSRKADGTMFNW